jgi:hypothetical protein
VQKETLERVKKVKNSAQEGMLAVHWRGLKTAHWKEC